MNWQLRRDLLSNWWERQWLCRVRRRHHEKMATRGHCYRCGKRLSS